MHGICQASLPLPLQLLAVLGCQEMAVLGCSAILQPCLYALVDHVPPIEGPSLLVVVQHLLTGSHAPVVLLQILQQE